MKLLKQLSIALFACLSGFANAQLPSSGGYAAAPDDWLLSNGRAWHHKTAASAAPSALVFRSPTAAEKPIIEKAMQLFQSSSAKSMALMNGNEVVWVGYKAPTNNKTNFMSFSVGKTVTSMAVGKAICARKFDLNSVAEKIVPELKETDLGKATVRNLLTMSSGTWEGNNDSTISTGKQDEEINQGRLSTLDLLITPEVSTAHKGLFGSIRKPGEDFAYRSTDPLVLGVIINKTTGMTYAKWVEQQVLLPAGIESQGIIGQDKFGFGNSAGNVRLNLEDWMRFAVWVKQNESAQGCFGDYVRQASRTQIENKSKKSGKLFDGYGYFIWTENLRNRDSYWAVGHGGQRIGWNHKNKRMIIAFSNVENYMDNLYGLYSDWVEFGDN
jgi:CubicO group peptidase (beta-lactamase class C family)